MRPIKIKCPLCEKLVSSDMIQAISIMQIKNGKKRKWKPGIQTECCSDIALVKVT